MKELSTPTQTSIITEHYPLPKQHQMRKSWAVAEARKDNEMRSGINRCTETSYHRIIDAVKLYLKPGEVYYERDHKHDKRQNALAMHCFMTSSSYIYLECLLNYEYMVEYAFHNCQYEADLRAMFAPFPLNHRAVEVELKPNFRAYYDTVLSVQEPHFLHSL